MADTRQADQANTDKEADVERQPRRGSSGSPGEGPVRERTSGASDSGERVVRGRGGYRPQDLCTIPANVTEVQGKKAPLDQDMVVMTNFVALTPMKSRQMYQYRVEFNPEIESVRSRKELLDKLSGGIFKRKSTFDGMYDLISGVRLPEPTRTYTEPDPRDPTKEIQLIIKRVGEVGGSFELTRIYNMNMKSFLRAMGFFQVQTGAYVHENLAVEIGSNTGISALQGYRTSANVHEGNQILMNLESVHKLVQHKNVLQQMTEMRRLPNFKEAIKSQLSGKLVVTNYNKVVYKIEDVNYDLSPSSTFRDERNNRDVTYLEYYQTRYNVRIVDQRQPLLLVIMNNTRQRGNEERAKHDIYLLPELCNIAGLTEQQRSDNRLKNDLIRASQIPPKDRVPHLKKFLDQLHSNKQISEKLESWGYSYAKEPLQVKGRILKTVVVGCGNRASAPPDKWNKVAGDTASFEREIMREKLASAPTKFKKLAILISRADAQNEGPILSKIKDGFDKIGLNPAEGVKIIRIREGDLAHHYIQYLRNLTDEFDAALVILKQQNKERYDAIKKFATVERGLTTQVVTSKLMMDDRKANGAAVKIGIQVAAKVGGDPWYVHIPLRSAMLCGYDTYHDTAQRGRSYGAFLASMNSKYSQWYSKVDRHDTLDELSAHLAENLGLAMKRFKEVNQEYPERVFIYRDGVSDGQLAHVYNTELKQIHKSIAEINSATSLTFTVVNKRIGARFYMCNNQSYINPPPGSVIDSVVTRKERYDFYLISQSTRNGTVTPTYYNIIHDESGLSATIHQQLAFKLCFLYYNWTGTVRVPAPCQYAHKLALLCGEHLHNVPNATLENNLHFL